ncbi:EexN family lipoprotein [Bartonella sp. AP57NXGY]|uniref:EexN family lipoprotein n=1 Tax=Bartonella sp. AP57NXGY TaxID=3243497 RepID=UPI0035CF4D56
MNKVLITTLLLCTGLMAAGCEKTYSVAEFKKNPTLMEEWIAKCGLAGTSKNCETLRLAQLELEKEYEAKAEERARKAQENLDKTFEKTRIRLREEIQRNQAEYERRQAEQQEKERKAKEQQDN